ncbi:unnamed protein product, partial [Prorocentrum cordatum]
VPPPRAAAPRRRGEAAACRDVPRPAPSAQRSAPLTGRGTTMRPRCAGGGAAETLLDAARQAPAPSALSLSTWGTLGARDAASACSTSETLGGAPAAKLQAGGSYFEAAAGTARPYLPAPSERGAADALEFLREPPRDVGREPGGPPVSERGNGGGAPPGPRREPPREPLRMLDLERAEALADEEGWADGEPGGGSGEREPLLRGPQGQASSKCQAARAQLESTSAAALACLALFVGMLMWRLQTDETRRLPLIVDFVPLFALPCLVYLLAVHFVVRHVSPKAALARWVVLAAGFVLAIALQALSICVFLRATDAVGCSWVAALTPLWATLAFLQLLLCFLVPGFMLSRALEHLAVALAALWASALSLLLAALKLDGQAEVAWWAALLPLGFVLSSRMAVRSLEGSPGAALPDAAGLIAAANLALRQDGVVELPWAAVLLPVLALLCHAARCSAAAGRARACHGAL